MADAPILIQRFDPAHAAAIASWIRDERELLWLSPETTYPLTAAKIIGWGGLERRQFVFHPPCGDPIGYAELNDMPGRADQQWIGHMLLDPEARGRSLGIACVQALLRVAFHHLASGFVLLVVVPENDRAIRCYLRAGFIHAGDEWKRHPLSGEPYRLLRMVIDRARYARLETATAEAHAEPLPV